MAMIARAASSGLGCPLAAARLTLISIAAMVGILAAMAFIPDQRTPLAAGLASLAIAVALFGLRRRLSGGPGPPSLRKLGPNARG